MKRPLLFTYRRCPYAMRARMALLQANVAFDAFEIVLRDKPAQLLSLSRKGTVPVLQTPTGQVIDQSWDIMQWAFEQHDPQGLWLRAQEPHLLALLAHNDAEFKSQLDQYKYPERWQVPDRSVPRAAALNGFIERLATSLARHSYLGGESMCAADLAIFPFVRQFAAVDADWFWGLEVQPVQNWLRRCLNSALFACCMTRLPDQESVLFPSLGGCPTGT